MNRRTLVLGTVAATAGVFGVGALLVQQNQTPLDSAPVVGKDTPLIRSYAPVMGNKDAPVTIVEFFDYNCGFCRRAMDDMNFLLATEKDVKFVMKELPILAPNRWKPAASPQPSTAPTPTNMVTSTIACWVWTVSKTASAPSRSPNP